jgi:hypothetical protein
MKAAPPAAATPPATPAQPAPKPRALSVENLESRLNLSTLSSLSHHPIPQGAGAAAVQTISTVRYRIEALDSGVGAVTYGASWTNPQFVQAQRYFNHIKKIPGNNTPITPAPTPDPTPPPSNTLPVTIAQSTEGKFARLTITGTSGNDSIVVSQSGATLTILANGDTTTLTGNFAELAIYGADGNDTITVQSSVHISSLLYGGAGANTLVAAATAQNFIVALGAGSDNVTGNGVNTSFWVDPSDTVHASSAEIAGGDVHKVASFYQPFTTNTSSPGYIPTTLNGQNLKDPTDSGATTRLNASLWGTGPSMTDINQGSVGDCYYLASLQSMALKTPGQLQQIAVDLGDGTYAVQFKRGGLTSYIRVDGDLPAGGWGGLDYAHPASGGGAIWASILEKAYAFFRTGANTFDSLNSGWTGAALSDLGVNTTTFSTSTPANTLFNQIAAGLANGHPIAAVTVSHTPAGSPIIGNHAYTVVSATVESGAQFITVRNPWGYDGAGSDGNANDGLVKISLAQFIANFSAGSIAV